MPDASGLPEELVPEAEEINDLWYGAAGSRHTQSDMYTYETVEVKNSVVTARRIELIRNTNLLKVTLSGLEHLTPESPGHARREPGYGLQTVGGCYRREV